MFDEETDLNTYHTSIKRMAALKDSVTLLFPGHNTPTAPAERLGELVTAFEQILDGTKAPEPNEADAHTESDELRYTFEHFSFLIRADLIKETGPRR